MTAMKNRYTITPRTWANIEEIEPDELDLLMLEEIDRNPECHEFVSSDEVMKELGL